MAHISELAFDSTDRTQAGEGYQNSSTFPDPQNETQVRKQIQQLHSQTRYYINTNVVPLINSHDDSIASGESSDNKVTSISSSSTDVQYPSAKCVYDNLETKQATLVSGTNIKTINSTSLLGSGNITINPEPDAYIKNASVSSNTLTLTKKDDSTVTFTADEATWGNIDGTLANQTDLQTALNAKQNTLTAGTGISISNNVISLSLSNANGQSF